MPSIKIVLMLSAIVLSVYLVDNCAGNPYPSIGKGKSKRLGNFCLLLLFNFVSDFVWKFSMKSFHVMTVMKACGKFE